MTKIWVEATDLALKTGNQIVKLTVSLSNDANPMTNPVVLGGIAVGVRGHFLFGNDDLRQIKEIERDSITSTSFPERSDYGEPLSFRDGIWNGPGISVGQADLECTLLDI
jgi:hypothetical protein